MSKIDDDARDIAWQEIDQRITISDANRFIEAYEDAKVAEQPVGKTLVADEKENVWRDDSGDIWEPIRARERESQQPVGCPINEESLKIHQDVFELGRQHEREALKRVSVKLAQYEIALFYLRYSHGCWCQIKPKEGHLHSTGCEWAQAGNRNRR